MHSTFCFIKYIHGISGTHSELSRSLTSSSQCLQNAFVIVLSVVIMGDNEKRILSARELATFADHTKRSSVYAKRWRLLSPEAAVNISN